jgi:hypothetical protein
MKKIIYFALICVCAYGILTYALDNPRGAERLRDDIGEVTQEVVEKGSEAVDSVREYANEVTD